MDSAVSFYDLSEGTMKGGQCIRGSFSAVPGNSEIHMKIWFDIGFLQFYVNDQWMVSHFNNCKPLQISSSSFNYHHHREMFC